MKSRNIPIHTDSGKTSRGTASEEPEEFRVVDKRHFAHGDADQPVSAPVEEKPRFPSFVEELMAKMSETERRFKEKVQQIDQETSRTKARLEAEYEREVALAKRDLLLPFLDVLDNLERALRAASVGGTREDLLEGLRMTAALFQARLRALAVEPIEVLNQPFDPNLSQAIGVIPTADQSKDGSVVEEVVRGYRMGESLLRPAQVRVGRHLAQNADHASL